MPSWGLAISGNETGNERPFLATSEEVFYLGNRSIAKREMRTGGFNSPRLQSSARNESEGEDRRAVASGEELGCLKSTLCNFLALLKNKASH
jgi:hypothetical protein